MTLRKFFYLVLPAILLILPFQNCGKQKSQRFIDGTKQQTSAFGSKLQDQTVAEGDPVTFVVDNGSFSKSVRYQWFKDGVILKVSSNILQITSTQLSDSGSYSVEIISPDFPAQIQTANLVVVSKTAQDLPGETNLGTQTTTTTPTTNTPTTKQTFLLDTPTSCVNGFCDVSIIGTRSSTPSLIRVLNLCRFRGFDFVAEYKIREGRNEIHCNYDGSFCFSNRHRENVVATSVTCTNNLSEANLQVICLNQQVPFDQECPN
jgi:hypothetical protein